jgi:hypothetical protein
MKTDIRLFKVWDFKKNKSSNPLLVNSLSPKSYFFICPRCRVSFYSRVCDVSKSYCCPSCEIKKKPKKSFYIDIEKIKKVITPKVFFYILLFISLVIIIALLFKIYFALINLPTNIY